MPRLRFTPYDATSYHDSMMTLHREEREALRISREISHKVDMLALGAFQDAMRFHPYARMLLPVPAAYWGRAMTQVSLRPFSQACYTDYLKTGLPMDEVFGTALETLRSFGLRPRDYREALLGCGTSTTFGGLLVWETDLKNLFAMRDREDTYSRIKPLWGNAPFLCRNTERTGTNGWFVIYPELRESRVPEVPDQRHTYVWHLPTLDEALVTTLGVSNSHDRAHPEMKRGRLTGRARDQALDSLMPCSVVQL